MGRTRTYGPTNTPSILQIAGALDPVISPQGGDRIYDLPNKYTGGKTVPWYPSGIETLDAWKPTLGCPPDAKPVLYGKMPFRVNAITCANGARVSYVVLDD